MSSIMVKELSRALRILAASFSRLDDMSMTEPAPTPHAERADWLRVLARGAPDELARLAAPVLADYAFDMLRAPEHGLVMVRARIGNRGDRFNVGEATVTRCAVRHRSAAGLTVAGVGHVLGNDAERAERMAQLDALLQVPDLQALLRQTVLQPLRAHSARRETEERARTEASRVRFFTLQPEAA
jgi:alpha-D-ribose 1-methylphosphonate 5-triphosphate synthase subunit PhnG